MNNVTKPVEPSREVSPVLLEVLIETRALISALKKKLNDGYFDGGNCGQVKAEPDR